VKSEKSGQEKTTIIDAIRAFLSPGYHLLIDGFEGIRFWFRRKLRQAARRGSTFPTKAALCILCVKRPAYVRLAIKNVNSLHLIYPGYKIQIETDDVCALALSRLGRRFDYPSMVEVINRFGKSSDPWQFQKVDCLMNASRNGWVLVDADTIWHSEPVIQPNKVTFLVKAYSFGDSADERQFLSINEMEKAHQWPHYVTGFVSLPPAFYSEELEALSLSWTRKAFSDQKLKRISEEVGVNVAIQTLIPRDQIMTLKEIDGPNDKNVMQSLYYGCSNKIEE
jgi:hypothetical protein